MNNELPNREAYIKAYQKLLQEKGYTESGLNNGKPEGTLAEALRAAFEDCAANKHNADGALIRIGLPGFTPEDEKFLVTFSFTYTSATEKYELAFMEADTEDFHMKIQPRSNDAIPSLPELHQHFNDVRELAQIKHKFSKKPINGKKFGLN